MSLLLCFSPFLSRTPFFAHKKTFLNSAHNRPIFVDCRYAAHFSWWGWMEIHTFVKNNFLSLSSFFTTSSVSAASAVDARAPVWVKVMSSQSEGVLGFIRGTNKKLFSFSSFSRSSLGKFGFSSWHSILPLKSIVLNYLNLCKAFFSATRGKNFKRFLGTTCRKKRSRSRKLFRYYTKSQESALHNHRLMLMQSRKSIMSC